MRRVGWFAALTIAAVACVSGCGASGSGVQASCTVSGSTSGASVAFCEEIQGVSPQDTDSLSQSCGIPIASDPDAGVRAAVQFTYGPCSRAGALGGCQEIVGTTVITRWTYDDGSGALTAADVQMACTASGGVFVQP